MILPVISLQASTTYSFKIRVYRTINGVKNYSGLTNVGVATTLAAAGVTGVEYTNNYSYPIISLVIDGQEYCTSAPQGIPAGGNFKLPPTPGTHSYIVQNGLWDGSTRFTLYTYSGSFNVINGVTYTDKLSETQEWFGTSIPSRSPHDSVQPGQSIAPPCCGAGWILRHRHSQGPIQNLSKPSGDVDLLDISAYLFFS